MSVITVNVWITWCHVMGIMNVTTFQTRRERGVTQVSRYDLYHYNRFSCVRYILPHVYMYYDERESTALKMRQLVFLKKWNN